MLYSYHVMNDLIPYDRGDSGLSQHNESANSLSLIDRLNDCHDDLENFVIHPKQSFRGTKLGVLAPTAERILNQQDIKLIQDQTNWLISNVGFLEKLNRLNVSPDLQQEGRSIRAGVKDFTRKLELFLSQPSIDKAQTLIKIIGAINTRLYALDQAIYNPQPTLNAKLDAATEVTQEKIANCIGGTAKALWVTTVGVGKVLEWGGRNAIKGGKALHAANQKRKVA